MTAPKQSLADGRLRPARAARRYQRAALGFAALNVVVLAAHASRKGLDPVFLGFLLAISAVAGWAMIALPDRARARAGIAAGALWRGTALLNVRALKPTTYFGDELRATRTSVFLVPTGDVTGDLEVTPAALHWRPARYGRWLRVAPITLPLDHIERVRVVPMAGLNDCAMVCLLLPTGETAFVTAARSSELVRALPEGHEFLVEVVR